MKLSIYATWPLYLAATVLVLNDHFLKYSFPGLVTGKLSDFAGIFLVCLISRALFPRSVLKVSVGIVVMFAYWKSNYSQPLIDLLNSHFSFKIGRVVDFTDLVAFIVLPLAHYVYENRARFTIETPGPQLTRVSAVILAMVGITGTSVLMPHDSYEIRKEDPEQSIEIAKATELICKIADQHDLQCIKCDPLEREGSFEDKKIKLRYKVLENNRGIAFDIEGNPGGLFFGGGSWDEMDQIKRELQNSLGNEFRNMEFVVKLGRN